MRRRILLILFLVPFFHCLQAQHLDTIPDITYGPLVSYFLFKAEGEQPGHLIEAGFFVNQRMANRFHVNVAAQISVYTKNEKSVDRQHLDLPYIYPDSIYQVYNGTLTYESVMLSIPLRGEFYFGAKKRIALVAGVINRFRLYDKVSWDYEILTVEKPNTVIASTGITSEKPGLRPFHIERIHIGLQYLYKQLQLTPIVNMDAELRLKNATGLNAAFRNSIVGVEVSWRM